MGARGAAVNETKTLEVCFLVGESDNQENKKHCVIKYVCDLCCEDKAAGLLL